MAGKEKNIASSAMYHGSANSDRSSGDTRSLMEKKLYPLRNGAMALLQKAKNALVREDESITLPRYHLSWPAMPAPSTSDGDGQRPRPTAAAYRLPR